jgi:hypothetical protein
MRKFGLSPVIVWSIVFGVIILLAFYAMRMAKRNDVGDGEMNDIGFAILHFGKAFPTEAIRELHPTADGKTVFLRLHDDKTGIMRSHSRHYSCHLIKPGRVRVNGLAEAKGFHAEFLDVPKNNGDFVFKSEADAAEVSLWLLGNYLATADKDAVEASA